MAASKTGKKLETGGGGYAPIGNSTNKFTAKFDGDEKTIKLTINIEARGEDAYAGVFGFVGKGGEICKLGVAKGSYISASSGVSEAEVGGIAGQAYGATITGCYNTGNVSANGADGNGDGIASCAGGIAGGAENGTTITGCYNIGTVTATADYGGNAGGIAGAVSGATISGCYNIGTVTATADYGGNAGGIAGYVDGAISGCYYLQKDENDTDSKGAQKGVGNNASYDDGSRCVAKTLEYMQAEEFAKALNDTITKKPDGVTQVFEFVSGRTPAVWWEKAEIDAALAAVDKVEGVLKNLKENGVGTSEAEKKLSKIKEKIKLGAPNEFPGLVEEAKKELLPLTLAEVDKVGAEAERLKGFGANIGEAEGELDNIKSAIEAIEVPDAEFSEKLTVQMDALGAVVLKLAKAEALAAVKKIEVEVIKQGQLYDEDTSAAEEELEGIKTEIGAATTVDEVKKQVEAAQGVLQDFLTKLQDKELNIGHTRSGIGGQAGFYKAKNGVVTFRVKPNPGYKISEIITSGSRLIKPGDVVKVLPERVTVYFKKV